MLIVQPLDDHTRQRLLKTARSAITALLCGTVETQTDEPWPALGQRGVFVTLRKRGRLRGCIGVFQPGEDVPSTVRKMAVAAARDPRFLRTPIAATEMQYINIEISILSPLRRVDDPSAVEPGLHGIHVKYGPNVGCFLPQVAVENGWDRQTFLSQCCGQKAGLDPSAWKLPETEISVFTVQQIQEETP